MENVALVGRGTAKPDAIHGWATKLGASRPDFLKDYLDNLYNLCITNGLNFDVLVAQSCHETAEDGVPWRSHWWRERGNPAGIGITGDPKQNSASRIFGSGSAAATAQFVHMWGYVHGERLPKNVASIEDPRWDALRGSGWMGTVTTTRDLSGKWAADAVYHKGIGKWLGVMVDAKLIKAIPASSPTGEPGMETKRRETPIVMAIGMGHRNFGRGGARGEYDWTPKAARALQRRAQARGMIAELIAENDGDKDANFSNTDRTTAARKGVDAIIKKHGRCDVVIFQHYNGGGAAGAHFLHPDGWSEGLTKEDNMGDVRMARAIAEEVGDTDTVSLLHPRWGTRRDEPGVMSERQSGAVKNIEGWRLGEMLGPEAHRASLYRIIAEAGSIDVAREAAFIRDDRWLEFTYCEAILNGVERELGVYRPGQTDPGPNPTPDPTPTDPGYDDPIRLPQLDAYDDAPKDAIPMAVKTDEGWFAYVGREVRTIRDTPRYQLPNGDGRTGDVVPAGEPIYIPWVNTGFSEPYGYTLWATRIMLDDTDFGVLNDGGVEA